MPHNNYQTSGWIKAGSLRARKRPQAFKKADLSGKIALQARSTFAKNDS
jgi:hypothetical protein